MRINDGMLIRAALDMAAKQCDKERVAGSGYMTDELYVDMRDRMRELKEMLTDSVLIQLDILSI